MPAKPDKPLYQQIRKPTPPTGWSHKSDKDYNRRKDKQNLRKDYASQLLKLARLLVEEQP